VNVLQRLRERFWFIPAVLCLAALAGASGLITLDEQLRDRDLPRWIDVIVYQVGVDGSREVLAAIATSSLAVAGTTFSITMAVLALTSSSYGPRLVRNFMADSGNQFVLGVYVATFLYSLLVLRSVRTTEDDAVFVPHVAVNVAGLLAVLNVADLVNFIHHISDSIQIATLAAGVRGDLVRTVDVLYPARIGHDADDGQEGRDAAAAARALGGITETAAVVRAGRSGYVQFVREDDLMAAARKHDVLVLLQTRPGQHVLAGTAVALIYPAARCTDELADDLRSATAVANSRTPHQDVEFAVQQLTEMAVRALSPGTNDPYTAINALEDLTVGLARLAGRPVPSPARYDDDGNLRVHAPRADPRDVVSGVLDAMRWYAADAPAAMHATLRLVERVGAAARNEPMRARLREDLELLREAFARAGHQDHDVRTFDERAREVSSALAPG
jgi:uncharacterized membrane protein